MNIAIIGGSGFIGSRLAKDLNKNSIDFFIVDKVISPLYPQLTRIGDVRNLEDLRTQLRDADTIINLAAEHRDDVTPVSLYTTVNVGGAQNVCQIATELGIHRIIFTSSVAVYGVSAPYSDESEPCNPFNEYGRTKLEAEKVYNAWSSQSNENRLAIVRPTVVFGEGNRGNVYNLFRQIAERRFLFVGNGNNHKAMAYVGNVSAFLMHLIQSSSYTGTWNYVDTPIPDMNSLVTAVRKKLNIGVGSGIHIPAFAGYFGGGLFDLAALITRRKFPISTVRIKKFMTDSSFSAAKAASTGFKPPFDLNESLDRVLSYEFDEKTGDE